jgi:hypothetical protein
VLPCDEKAGGRARSGSCWHLARLWRAAFCFVVMCGQECVYVRGPAQRLSPMTSTVVTAWRDRRFHANSVCAETKSQRGPGRKPWRRPWESADLMPGAGLVWNVECGGIAFSVAYPGSYVYVYVYVCVCVNRFRYITYKRYREQET